MTYSYLFTARHNRAVAGVAVSHSAELVRGACAPKSEGPLIRPFGPPSPQGEKDLCRARRVT
jgi:hypothetical protein